MLKILKDIHSNLISSFNYFLNLFYLYPQINKIKKNIKKKNSIFLNAESGFGSLNTKLLIFNNFASEQKL